MKQKQTLTNSYALRSHEYEKSINYYNGAETIALIRGGIEFKVPKPMPCRTIRLMNKCIEVVFEEFMAQFFSTNNYIDIIISIYEGEKNYTNFEENKYESGLIIDLDYYFQCICGSQCKRGYIIGLKFWVGPDCYDRFYSSVKKLKDKSKSSDKNDSKKFIDERTSEQIIIDIEIDSRIEIMKEEIDIINDYKIKFKNFNPSSESSVNSNEESSVNSDEELIIKTVPKNMIRKYCVNCSYLFNSLLIKMKKGGNFYPNKCSSCYENGICKYCKEKIHKGEFCRNCFVEWICDECNNMCRTKEHWNTCYDCKFGKSK